MAYVDKIRGSEEERFTSKLIEYEIEKYTFSQIYRIFECLEMFRVSFVESLQICLEILKIGEISKY